MQTPTIIPLVDSDNASIITAAIERARMYKYPIDGPWTVELSVRGVGLREVRYIGGKYEIATADGWSEIRGAA